MAPAVPVFGLTVRSAARTMPDAARGEDEPILADSLGPAPVTARDFRYDATSTP